MIRRTALVTGASSGIGAAIARALAAAGYTVVACARRADRLEQVVASIRAAGGSAQTLVRDLARPEVAASTIATASEVTGRLDVLVNDAGIMLNGHVDDVPLEDLEAMLAINLQAVIALTKAAIPVMRAGGGGHVVNIASVAATNHLASTATYAASKAGVIAFSDAVRKEVRSDKIRVTVVIPGMVSTELFEKVRDARARATLTSYLAGMQPLRAEDVAETIVFAVTRPPHVGIHEITIRPSDQET